MGDANEESEITEGMGRMLRTAMAGGMQLSEAAARKRQSQQSQQQQAEQQTKAEEAKVATALRQDAYSREFWRSAGSEAIADRVTVAGQYSGQQPEARSAYMHMSDVLRNDYGINIEQLNRDHPTSVTDRHHALRDALDDYFASRTLDAEADQLDQQAAQAEQHRDSQSHGADPDREAGEESSAEAGQDSRAQSGEQLSGQAEEARDQSAARQASESANLQQADRHGAESHRDATHTRAEESTGGRQPRPYERVSEASLAQAAKQNPQAAAARRASAMNFPAPARDMIQQNRTPQARKNVAAPQKQNRQVEVSR